MPKFISAILIVLACVSANTPGAHAQSGVYTFKFTNHTSYTLYLKLFSQARSWTWPNANESWILNDRAEHSLRISCRVGEKICFGASWQNRAGSWGVGMDNKLGCTSCCADCGSQNNNWHHSWTLTD